MIGALVLLHPSPTFLIMSAAPQSSTGSRSRPQARKKPNDDATYFGPPLGGNGASGTKRQAAEKAEGEPRVKRKRVDISAAANSNRRDAESEPKASLVGGVAFGMSAVFIDALINRWNL